MVTYSSYDDPTSSAAVQPKMIDKMPILKEVNSSSTVSWCPLESHKELLAAGTVSGTIDDSFQTSSRLTILNTSLSDRTSDMQVLGQARVKDADFVRISWGAKGSNDSSKPLGLIAGGMSDGSVLLWCAEGILNGTNHVPIAAKRHGSHVSGLSFHPTEQNLIASGSADSEVLIWDLKNLSSPTSSPPGPAGNTEKSSIVDIAWNLKVAHILACSSSNGQTSVWDLRQKRAVITFTESTHRHVPATAVSWDPTQARQLVVSYAYPAAEVWDLRYGMAPKQILQGGHSRGSILTVAWSQYDSNIILTTGEDATICIWSAQEGQLLDSIQDRGTTFCLKWHPFNAELLAGSTYEGNVTVRSISNTGQHVPEWKGRPCGGTFGFGSRLVIFGTGFSKFSIRCFKVSTEPEFIRMASEFQSDISQTDMKTFCAQKISKFQEDTEEKMTWEFLRLMFESDSRFRFLSHLGFPAVQSQPISGNDFANGNVSRTVSGRIDDVSDEDFFNQLSPGEKIGNHADTDIFNGAFSSTCVSASPVSSLKRENQEEESDLDNDINSLLVIGDIERATNLCVKSKRMADALIIASLGSNELQIRIQQLYMDSHTKHYIRSIALTVAGRDIQAYIKRSDLSRWKETLALIITYCSPEQYIPTVRALVDRLSAVSMNQAAIVCCLCCSDLDGAALQWQKQEHQHSGRSRIDVLQSSVEKLYVMSQACGQTTGPSASGLYAEYAGLLSAQGAMSMALSFLQIAGGGTDELAYRIYYSGVSPESMAPPPQPFYVKNVASAGQKSTPSRMSNNPGGLRRGPAPSQSSVGDSKPSSVPPQNRLIRSMAAPAAATPRGHPPAGMRPPYKPASGIMRAPSVPRPNSVPPQETGMSSTLPSRHLLNDGPTTYNGSGLPSSTRVPSGGFSSSASGRPGTFPSSLVPASAGQPSNHLSAPGRVGPVSNYGGITQSPSMSPALVARSSLTTGRLGPPSRPSSGMGPPVQRGGPSPARFSPGPAALSAPNARQAPSPMGPMAMSQPAQSSISSAPIAQSFQSRQMPKPNAGRSGHPGIGNRMLSPSSSKSSVGPRPTMQPPLSGPTGAFPIPKSVTQPAVPARFHLQSGTSNVAAGPHRPTSGPQFSARAPPRPGMNPVQNQRQLPVRPGMDSQFHAQAPSQPPFRSQQASGFAHEHGDDSMRSSMDPLGRHQNQPPAPFRPGPTANLSTSQSPAPFRLQPNISSPSPQQYAGTLSAQTDVSSSSIPTRPGPPNSPARFTAPARPGMPQRLPNFGGLPPSSAPGFVTADALQPQRGSALPYPAQGRPGFGPTDRSLDTMTTPIPLQQYQQHFPFSQSSSAHRVAPFTAKHPVQNPLHQSSNQPHLQENDSFSLSNPSTAYSNSQVSDPFSSDFTTQQRASVPVYEFAGGNSSQVRSPSPPLHSAEKLRVSPTAKPLSPNHSSQMPSANQQASGRNSPKRNDLVSKFQSALSDLSSFCQDAADKAAVDGIRTKFDAELYTRISSGSFSAIAIKALASLADAVQSRDKSGVQQANISLITDCWAEVKTILPVIKFIVEISKRLFN